MFLETAERAGFVAVCVLWFLEWMFLAAPLAIDKSNSREDFIWQNTTVKIQSTYGASDE